MARLSVFKFENKSNYNSNHGQFQIILQVVFDWHVNMVHEKVHFYGSDEIFGSKTLFKHYLL